MKFRAFAATPIIVLAVASEPVLAGTEPLYAPSPDWVTVTPMPAAMSADPDAGPRMDWQERFENGQTWSYADFAIKISSTAMLNQVTNITLPWYPDKGDLIIHEVSALRNGKVIDLLAQGQKFNVLHREQLLEQLQLTGILTGNFVPEGLQVGDVLRFRTSVTVRDTALGKRVQWSLPLISEMATPTQAAIRLSWPSNDPVRWKVRPDGIKPIVTQKGAWTELSVPLPIVRQPEMPADAPLRYKAPSAIEVSGFSGWQDVSAAFAAYYQPAPVAAGTPLATEIERIRKASPDPLARAELALRSVQENVRYLAIGMEGGNYLPQAPDKTWQVRYGDCKAKSLLLITVLKELGIGSEAMLANTVLDDLVPDRLPAPQAFNHVFVRAKLGERTLWLDGTRSWTRAGDLGDPPPFRNLLAIRPGGAQLETIALVAPALPTLEVRMDADQSTSVDLPIVSDVTMTYRRDQASMLSAAINAMPPKERDDALNSLLQSQVGEGQYVNVTRVSDIDAGTFTVTARGLLTTQWKTEDTVRKLAPTRTAGMVAFAPDRSKAIWNEIPAATPSPDRQRYRLRIRLPENGRGMSTSGDLNFTGSAGGFVIQRNASLKGGIFESDEMITTAGSEIPAAQIGAERDLVARVVGGQPKIAAPADARRRWDLGKTGANVGSQFDAISAVLRLAAAKAEKDDTSSYITRANLLIGIGKRKEALADVDKVIAIEPTIENYLWRSRIKSDIEDIAGALADAEAARKLDPSSIDAIANVAFALAREGKVDESITLLDERIGLGGEAADTLKMTKAEILGEFGDAATAIAIVDDLLVSKPGNATLLNSRCWIRGTRQIELESALKDCTKAIELSDNTAAILDSRAIVWLRLGKFEDALLDINAALMQQPDLGQSRFVKAIILKRLGKANEATIELNSAEILAPATAKSYEKFGLVP